MDEQKTPPNGTARLDQWMDSEHDDPTLESDQVAEPAARHAAPTWQGRLQRARLRFRQWRRCRPFWGPVLLALGGWFVVRPVLSSMSAVVQLGSGGVVAYVLGGGMVLAAGVAMFRPEQRHFPALMAVLLAVASLPLANLGGWVIGMVLGIVGGAMTFAWTPFTPDQVAAAEAKNDT
ncbi:DUF6114 domain-containing protein [Demetria terragena]|uniref:DUF6114 domain-containing protein n=1 Tax=Demetria terragena TaxID=63959 RepID=UPI001B7FAD73|nr:DUF6114 domain-containing protein [Demetria terragena]